MMPMAAPSSTVFACEWAARRLPAAASPGQELVTVTCIGRVHAGQIIQVLTSGSTRVRLLGCPESRCR
ncbi:hydrogenase iron-sulfur subunit, partial [candidate division WOR-3 bacterium]|nr:hydrogenase iron-sulfur subunit [candidate division WOR-3 bacterium]